MPLHVIESPEAMAEYEKWQNQLEDVQKMQLLNATISLDGNEWCIMSGPDLTFDRAGFGKTIEAAMQDYVSVYIKRAS